MRKSLVFPTRAAADATPDDPSVIITTNAVDRDSDVVVPEGVRLSNWLKNPVVLFGHNHFDIPVGRGTRAVVEPGEGIRAHWKWLEGDPFADRVKNAWNQGVLNAASIGFGILKSEPRPDSRFGLRITESDLSEFSIVPVGANPEALKALGLNPPIDRALAELVRDDNIDEAEVARVLADKLPAILAEEVAAQIRHITGRVE